MNKILNPETIGPTNGAYSHAVEVPAGARTLHIAGQVAIAPDGSVPADFEAQAHQVWRNLVAILEAANMTVHDLVHVNHWLVDQADFETYIGVRAKYQGDARPAATLMIVKDLVNPKFRIEVGAVAAKID